MKPTAIVMWRHPFALKHFRICLRCFIYLNGKHEPDASEYTRAWIRDYNARPAEEKCNHERMNRCSA
jgi:hypothetical protein